MSKFIVYHDGEEAIVTTKKNEAETIRLFFVEGGRDLEDYCRDEQEDIAVKLTSEIRVDI